MMQKTQLLKACLHKNAQQIPEKKKLEHFLAINTKLSTKKIIERTCLAKLRQQHKKGNIDWIDRIFTCCNRIGIIWHEEATVAV